MKYLISLILLISTSSYGKPQATGLLLGEYGVTYPQNHLSDYLSEGNAMRFRIFGGAKFKLGAVGLGWDITYSQYTLKDNLDGHYNRLTWDWLFLPINIGFLQITPGIAWVITDVYIPDLSLKEQSIRPASVLALGMRLGLIGKFAITAQVRGESVWEDMEPVSAADQEEWNITGQYITATVGGMLHF